MADLMEARREGYLLEDFRFFHLRDTAGQELDYHFHEFDKLVIPLSGRVTYEVESSVYPLRPWDILLVKHHTIHKAHIDRTEPYERIILYLDRRYIERSAPETRLMECFDLADRTGRHRLIPDPACREKLAWLLGELEQSLAEEQFGAKTLETAILQHLLVCLDRLALEGIPAPEPGRETSDRKIGQALTYINENLGRELSVDQLSAQVYMSRSHFTRLFRQQTGSPVHTYIRQQRLLYAAKLIRGGMPAGQAAAESGYSDYSAFFRAFRECFGASPSDIK